MGEARDLWLHEGVMVLAEEGAGGVRIDRLARRLGLSRGSFHRHFDGAAGFKKKLLVYIEATLTGSLYRAASEAEDQRSPRDILIRLISLVGSPGSELYRRELRPHCVPGH